MQETLDDAIWVLKNHAESSLARSPYVHTGRYPPTLTDQLHNAPIDGSAPIDNNSHINSHLSTPQALLGNQLGNKSVKSMKNIIIIELSFEIYQIFKKNKCLVSTSKTSKDFFMFLFKTFII